MDEGRLQTRIWLAAYVAAVSLIYILAMIAQPNALFWAWNHFDPQTFRSALPSLLLLVCVTAAVYLASRLPRRSRWAQLLTMGVVLANRLVYLVFSPGRFSWGSEDISGNAYPRAYLQNEPAADDGR